MSSQYEHRFGSAGRGRRPALWLACLATVVVWSSTAFAASPTTMMIEGFVHTAVGPAVDGDYTLSFALYAGQNAGVAFWQEADAKVSVNGGHFAYVLGQTKALDAALFGNAPEVWVGITVAKDPELPRGKLHSVGFALRAAVADLASGLACTGCVKASSLIWDADIDVGGQSVKANQVTAKVINGQSVIAQEFIGNGSKLTGIKLPSGSCPGGESMTGIASDGSLICKKLVSEVPGGTLAAVSGGALTNEFNNVESAPTKNVAIPDNTGLDALSTIEFSDVGIAKDFSVTLDIESSDLSQVAVVLLPPNDKKNGYTICDPCGLSGEKVLKVTIPKPFPMKLGNLSEWIGVSPVGLWNLKVKDTGFCIPQKPGNEKICDVVKGTDGWIHDWSIQVKTISQKDVAVTGQLVAYAGIQLGGSSAPCTSKRAGSLRYLVGDGLALCNGSSWVIIGK